MARASTLTLLSLDRFFQLIGMHPLHANQVLLQDLRICGSPLVQYSWQRSDTVGREEVAQAIADAESSIEEWLGYAPLPKWYEDERVVQPIGGLDISGRGQAVKVSGGYLITGGIEAKVSLQAGLNVVYDDTDGDGYKERATITINGLPSYITNAEEIAIYYPGQSGNSAWEIRPITVSLAGATAIIRCGRHQLVKPEVMEVIGGDIRGVDGLLDANFLTSVDVYRHYNDPQRQVQFLWENGCNCGTTACGYATQWGCLLIRNNRLGLVSGAPADWDSVNNTFTSSTFSPCRYPDRARLWYRAGFRSMDLATPHLTMAPRLERAIAYYALGLLSRPLCGCNAVKEISQWWSYDMASTFSSSGGTVARRVTSRQLENPFGTTRGALYAWNVVKQARLGESVVHA